MTAALPQLLADEVLRQYADVLRVGRVVVNGVDVSWDTSASNGVQLQHFTAEFVKALRRFPELASLDDSTFCNTAYWFCKVVSINYALSEVLDLLAQKVGAVCSINTCQRGGQSLVSYRVDVRSKHSMKVYMEWQGKDNIVSCDPRTGKRRSRGTLSRVETTFPLPPESTFVPTYTLHMRLRSSRTSRLMSAVTCASANTREQGEEHLLVRSPLHSANLAGGLHDTCSTDVDTASEGLDSNSASTLSFESFERDLKVDLRPSDGSGRGFLRQSPSDGSGRGCMIGLAKPLWFTSRAR
jgi:hypothetical protein